MARNTADVSSGVHVAVVFSSIQHFVRIVSVEIFTVSSFQVVIAIHHRMSCHLLDIYALCITKRERYERADHVEAQADISNISSRARGADLARLNEREKEEEQSPIL
jgi:hypothetical protein